MRRPSVIVPGFRFSAVSAGIKRSGAPDLGLIFSERAATVAGVFTSNRIKAAPVRLALRQISSRKARAVIVNSGNANACTGEQGYRNAVKMAERTARELGISSKHVFVSSTGVIGRTLPIEKITDAIPALVGKLSPSDLDKIVPAIMTTDTFPKQSSKKILVNGKRGTIAGIAKGAGMICPNMATMLCFIMTDIAVRPGALDSALRHAVRHSFNRITIDNDMSTNDTVLIMANGLLGNSPLSSRSPEYRIFSDAVLDIAQELANMIVRDGEGATKFIMIIVDGAKSEADAEMAARSVATSMLVKTAIYGRDPNWGRIIAAVGYSNAKVDEKKVDIYLNNVKLVNKGVGTGKEPLARELLTAEKITIRIDLGLGTKSAQVNTCDMSENYVKINAHYTT